MRKKVIFAFYHFLSFFRTITLANTCSITNIYRKKKKLRKKLKTCVTPLIVAPIKSGPLELRCELTHNTTTTPLLALFSRLPHKFLPVRGLSVSLILCLYLSFFAPNSHRFSQSAQASFFFPRVKIQARALTAERQRGVEAAPLFSSFLHSAHSLQTVHTVRIHVCCCLTVTQKARGTNRSVQQPELHTLHYKLICFGVEGTRIKIIKKIIRKYFTQLTYLVSDSDFTSTDVPGQREPRLPYCRLNLGQKCRRHTLII